MSEFDDTDNASSKDLNIKFIPADLHEWLLKESMELYKAIWIKIEDR